MIVIISTCKDKLSEFEFIEPLKKIIGNCEIISCFNIDKKEILKADKIVISGTALKDFDYLDCDFEWLKKFNKPVLGICAGMQTIGKTFGCELKDEINIGVKKVRVVKENKLMSEDANAYFLHTKIIEGGNFDVVALCDETPAIIRHKSKEIYGCIFHPEVLNSEIIKNFVHE